MSRSYIENHFADIVAYGSVIESRLDDSVDKAELLAENAKNLTQCKACDLPYILLDKTYEVTDEAFS